MSSSEKMSKNQDDEANHEASHQTSPQDEAPPEAAAPRPLPTLPRYALSMLSWFFERQAGAQLDDTTPRPDSIDDSSEAGMRLLRQHERAVLYKIIVWLHRIDSIEEPTGLWLPLHPQRELALRIPVQHGKILLDEHILDALPALSPWHAPLAHSPERAHAVQLASLLLHQARHHHLTSWNLDETPLDAAPAHRHVATPLSIILAGRMGVELPRCVVSAFHAHSAPSATASWLWRSSKHAFTDTLLDAAPLDSRLSALYEAVQIAHAATRIHTHTAAPTISFSIASDLLWVVAGDGACASIQLHAPSKMGMLVNSFTRIRDSFER